MKIFYDYQIFYWQRYGGISTYFCNLINNLKKLDNQIKIISPIYTNQLVEEFNLNKEIYGYKIPKIPRFSRKFLKYLNDIFFEYYSYRNNADIIHHTYYEKILDFRKKKNVLTVYDLIHEKSLKSHTQDFFRAKAKAIARADHIICISKNTQNDLLEFYKVKKEKTSVIYLASSYGEKFSKKKDKGSFVLYVGDRKGYKNFNNFIQAISISSKILNNVKIVCFGGGKFSKDEINYFNNLGFKENMVLYYEGKSSELEKLYLNAAILVYPSKYEGFGLPILEAMSLGCPVACSNTSSLVEVAGNSAKYFDPENIENIKDSIEHVLFSESNQNNLIQEGFKQNKKFSWSLCSKETMLTYKNVS